ncbi:hypothetical protein PAL_GLEAN10007243 [Pteropus alecto]|uniref:Uncharacterized protein n=1 Tax=Pteropus alecto TaxID=9402 RepID=L5K8Z9_PTEAL|nr:hypothetical protein PAL_GLEAN10007243 [Pteropus alecto]
MAKEGHYHLAIHFCSQQLCALLLIRDKEAMELLEQLVFQVPKVMLALGVMGLKTGPQLFTGAAPDSPAFCSTDVSDLCSQSYGLGDDSKTICTFCKL